MIYLRHVPSAPLNRFVEYLWFYTGFFPDHSVERVLPDGAVELLIDLHGPPKKLYTDAVGGAYRVYRRAWISGQHSQFIVIGTEQNASMMGVHFRAGGAFPFLSCPVSELNDDVVELEHVWGPRVRSLHEQLSEAPSPQEKFRILETMLRAVGKDSMTEDLASSAALAELQMAHDPVSIKLLSKRLGLSQRQLLRRFEEHVGLRPKALARIFRFQNVLKRLEAERKVHWAEIACEAGYYDQSHFVKEFQEMTGLNPSRYLVDKRDYANYVPIR